MMTDREVNYGEGFPIETCKHYVPLEECPYGDLVAVESNNARFIDTTHRKTGIARLGPFDGKIQMYVRGYYSGHREYIYNGIVHPGTVERVGKEGLLIRETGQLGSYISVWIEMEDDPPRPGLDPKTLHRLDVRFNADGLCYPFRVES
jgi:hypothetical protein